MISWLIHPIEAKKALSCQEEEEEEETKSKSKS